MRDDITYVMVDTLHHKLSDYALQKSQARFPLKHTPIFSDKLTGGVARICADTRD